MLTNKWAEIIPGVQRSAKNYLCPTSCSYKQCHLLIPVTMLIAQSHDFWRAYSLFVAQVASFVPERSEGAKLMMSQGR